MEINRWATRKARRLPLQKRMAQRPREYQRPAAIGLPPFGSCPFVFLNLLERKAKRFGNLPLAHAQDHAPHTQSAADVFVDGVRRLALWHLSTNHFDSISVRVQAQG